MPIKIIPRLRRYVNMTRVDKINCCGFNILPNKLDPEYKRILKKLKEYGMSATGDKEVDKARLKEKELEMAKEANYINPDF